MPLYDDERQSYWMLPDYMKMLEAEGAVPVMFPLTTKKEELDVLISLCGGFLLTGGHDVTPSFYGAEKSPRCGECCLTRDIMDGYVLKKAVETDLPVLGICRGIQLMNAAYGGTLYQDLPSERKGGVEHHMSPPYDRVAHKAKIIEGGLLYKIIGKDTVGVNSYHHQAVKDLSPAFNVEAVSEDGIVEGISMPNKKFVLGVQWHPEFFYRADEVSKKIVAAFVKSI